MKKPTDADVIKKLGGVKNISKILNIPYPTVNNWKSRGIAAKTKVKYSQYFMPDSLDDIKRLTEADRLKV